MNATEQSATAGQTLMERLPRAEKVEALEIGDALRDASLAALQDGDAEKVYKTIAQLVERVDNSPANKAANAVLEALVIARDSLEPEHDIIEAQRIGLEIAMMETVLNTRRLLTAFQDNLRPWK